MDTIRIIDISVFFFINHLPHTVWSDFIAEAFSGFGYAWGVWFVIGVVLFLRKERKDHWFWVPLGIAALFCYGLSELALKNIVMRPRPDTLAAATAIGLVPGSFSFPSTHATVAFAFAYLFSRRELHPIWLYVLAVCVCFSRIYLGHHYPTDIIGGMLLGTIIGMVSMRFDDALHRTMQGSITHSSKNKRKRV